MEPGTHNITIQRGEDFSLTFNVTIDGTVLDLSGATAYAQIRATQDRTSTLLLDFSTAISDTGASGGNYVTITAADTDTAGVSQSHGWYDVLIVDSSNVDTYYLRGRVVFEGSITVKP